MRSIGKRLLNLEKIIKSKHNHSGAFIMLIKNGIFEIQNKEDKGKYFGSEQELEDYIYNNYEAEKYVFITFDISKISI